MEKKAELMDLKGLESRDSSTQFSTVINLFEAMGISEKGIEIVYDYLLHNKMIEDPKSIFEKLDLSLKRVYKIFSVLKELGLIQIYDRPMKVVINPPLSSWQRLLSKKINEMREETERKVKSCEYAFQQVVDAYQLVPEAPPLPPVEFISFLNQENLLEMALNEIIPEQSTLIAKGLAYESPINAQLQTWISNIIQNKNQGYIALQSFLDEWVKKIPLQKIHMLISEEYFNEITIKFRSYKDIIQKTMTIIKFPPINVEIKIIPKSFGNFVVKDEKELYQFSIDPNNTLVGWFVSRQREIIQIFKEKYEDLTKNAESIENFLARRKETLTILEKIMVLCL